MPNVEEINEAYWKDVASAVMRNYCYYRWDGQRWVKFEIIGGENE